MAEDRLTHEIIAAAIEVHKQLGPGLLESAYESCLVFELMGAGFSVERQKSLPVCYKGNVIDCGYRLDLVVDHQVVLELKAVDQIAEIHRAQLLSYLKLSGLKRGLLMNFNVTRLVDGIQRFVM